MRELLLEKLGPPDVAAVFHEDEGEGYFVLYRLAREEVIQQVQLYPRAPHPEVQEEDVEIFWSQDQRKACISVWGRMRAILDVEGKEEKVCPLQTPDSPAIQSSDTTSEFPQYLDRKEFLEARKSYWKAALMRSRPDLKLPDQPISLLDTRFVVASVDSHGKRAAVFEDEGETGYLYVYSISTATIEAHVHVYDRTEALPVTRDSVDVLWSVDESKCAVRILGQWRGIIDTQRKREGRVWMEGRETPGISDKEWLRGFEVM